MGVPPAMLQLPSGRRFPPTLFVHMLRDGSTAESVRQDVAALRAAGTPAAEIQIKPRPVTAEFLSSHAPQIGPEMAAAIVEALGNGGMLDSKGMFTRNPRCVKIPLQDERLTVQAGGCAVGVGTALCSQTFLFIITHFTCPPAHMQAGCIRVARAAEEGRPRHLQAQPAAG